MQLSGFDVLLVVAVPLAVLTVGMIVWWASMARYRRAAAYGPAAYEAEVIPLRPALRGDAAAAQPAPTALAAGGKSESAVLLTP
jgi:hypothetical protein